MQSSSRSQRDSMSTWYQNGSEDPQGNEMNCACAPSGTRCGVGLSAELPEPSRVALHLLNEDTQEVDQEMMVRRERMDLSTTRMVANFELALLRPEIGKPQKATTVFRLDWCLHERFNIVHIIGSTHNKMKGAHKLILLEAYNANLCTINSSDINSLIWPKMIQNIPNENVRDSIYGTASFSRIIAGTSNSIVRSNDMDFSMRMLEPEPAPWDYGNDIFFVIDALEIGNLVVTLYQGSSECQNGNMHRYL